RPALGAAPHCRDAFLDFVLDVAFDVREHYERVQRPSLAPQRAGPAPAPAGWGPAGEPEPLDAAQSSPGPPAPRHLSSDVATVLVILKSFVGGTLLVVPREFLRAGVLSGTVLFWAVGLLKLLQAHQQRGGSLGTLARLALGAAGAAAVECSVVLSQLGFAAAEMIYVARNGASALEWLSENSPAASAWLGEVDVAGMTATLTWLQLLFIVPASWYRELSAFTVYNFVGNVLVLGTVVFLSSITVTGLAREGMSQDWELGCPTKQALVFLGFSTYAFEGINMVIPMYRVHRDKNTFAGLLVATIVGIIMLFSVFACSNVFLYGQSVKPILTLNLPQKSAAAGLVPLAFSLASLVLVPLMVFPTFEILEGAARRGCGALLVGSPARVNALRGAVVLLCAVVAREGGAYLDVFLSLVAPRALGAPPPGGAARGAELAAFPPAAGGPMSHGWHAGTPARESAQARLLRAAEEDRVEHLRRQAQDGRPRSRSSRGRRRPDAAPRRGLARVTVRWEPDGEAHRCALGELGQVQWLPEGDELLDLLERLRAERAADVESVKGEGYDAVLMSVEDDVREELRALRWMSTELAGTDDMRQLLRENRELRSEDVLAFLLGPDGGAARLVHARDANRCW
ncbi:unnamed protein product, partial [Prorocentrum cordatum]